jgi:hypothetical protein
MIILHADRYPMGKWNTSINIGQDRLISDVYILLSIFCCLRFVVYILVSTFCCLRFVVYILVSFLF